MPGQHQKFNDDIDDSFCVWRVWHFHGLAWRSSLRRFKSDLSSILCFSKKAWLCKHAIQKLIAKCRRKWSMFSLDIRVYRRLSILGPWGIKRVLRWCHVVRTHLSSWMFYPRLWDQQIKVRTPNLRFKKSWKTRNGWHQFPWFVWQWSAMIWSNHEPVAWNWCPFFQAP